MPDWRGWDEPEEDEVCPYCGEPACEHTCTAALAAGEGGDLEDEAPLADDGQPSLGSCCICETTGPTVRTLVMLNAKAMVRGHGWGCVQCGLPPHGALAVICDACAAHAERDPTPRAAVEDALRFACRGYPASEGRLPIASLLGEHGHDWAQHPEATQAPPLTVLATDTRFGNHVEEGQGCHCSRCGQTIWEGTVAIRAFAASGAYQCRYHGTCFGALPMDDDPYSAADDGGDTPDPWELPEEPAP